MLCSGSGSGDDIRREPVQLGKAPLSSYNRSRRYALHRAVLCLPCRCVVQASCLLEGFGRAASDSEGSSGSGTSSSSLVVIRTPGQQREREIKRKAREVNRQRRRLANAGPGVARSRVAVPNTSGMWEEGGLGSPEAVYKAPGTTAELVPSSPDVVEDQIDGPLETFERSGVVRRGNRLGSAGESSRNRSVSPPMADDDDDDGDVTGDGRSGRVQVVSLTTAARSNSGLPEWKLDEVASNCVGCGVVFSLFRRKQ